MDKFAPMLAGKFDEAKQKFPVWLSPKLDGVRMLVKDGVCLSRSLKPFPNKALQEKYGRPQYEGYDGELIVGKPTDANVCDATRSEVMRIDGPCTAEYFVFDRHDKPDMRFCMRLAYVSPFLHEQVHVLQHVIANDMDDLTHWETKWLEMGYEGAMIRDPNGLYKYGRSTTKEGGLLKVKRYVDSEAVIIGMEELMHNANEAFESELGKTKRQTLQENMVPMGTMGALIVRDVKTGVQFNIGTGFNTEQRQWFWDHRAGLVEYSTIIRYKSFPIGVKDKPRHPVYDCIRDPRDM